MTNDRIGIVFTRRKRKQKFSRPKGGGIVEGRWDCNKGGSQEFKWRLSPFILALSDVIAVLSKGSQKDTKMTPKGGIQKRKPLGLWVGLDSRKEGFEIG